MPGITEAFFRSPKLGEWTDDLAPGLILVVRPAKTGRVRKSWVLRVVVDDKRRKIGLGNCGLAEARRRAAEARQAPAAVQKPASVPPCERPRRAGP
jgi:hypothetical protein